MERNIKNIFNTPGTKYVNYFKKYILNTIVDCVSAAPQTRSSLTYSVYTGTNKAKGTYIILCIQFELYTYPWVRAPQVSEIFLFLRVGSIPFKGIIRNINHCIYKYFIIYLHFIYRDLADNPLVCGCELTRAFSGLNANRTNINGTCENTNGGGGRVVVLCE